MNDWKRTDSLPCATQKSQPYRERLVATLQKQGALCSAQVAHAFLQVPREAFVSAWYQREAEPGMVWTRRAAADVEPA